MHIIFSELCHNLHSVLFMESRNWLELPSEIMCMILNKLGAPEILAGGAENVCSSWRKICHDPLMWRVIDTHGFDDFDNTFEFYCRRAVDRSRGQLVDISIEYSGTDDLLQYIAQSSNQLRRLKIVACHQISENGLIGAVSKLPLLESFEVFVNCFNVETLRTVGKCCPLLKSLKLNRLYRRIPNDEEALAIVETMSKLQYLQIFCNGVTNKGLQAILDGCPDLEYLDLRGCLNLDLKGQLGQICAQRIKILHLPVNDDDIDDDEFCTLFDDHIPILALTEYDFDYYHDGYHSSDFD